MSPQEPWEVGRGCFPWQGALLPQLCPGRGVFPSVLSLAQGRHLCLQGHLFWEPGAAGSWRPPTPQFPAASRAGEDARARGPRSWGWPQPGHLEDRYCPMPPSPATPPEDRLHPRPCHVHTQQRHGHAPEPHAEHHTLVSAGQQPPRDALTHAPEHAVCAHVRFSPAQLRACRGKSRQARGPSPRPCQAPVCFPECSPLLSAAGQRRGWPVGILGPAAAGRGRPLVAASWGPQVEITWDLVGAGAGSRQA